MTKILRFDNQLPNDVSAAVMSFFNNVQFRYGWQSSKDAAFMHWNRGFADVHSDNESDIEPLLRANIDNVRPIVQTWDALKVGLLSGHKLIRCYANAHTYGIEGYPHVDSRKADTWTTIVYVNEAWQPQWAGETVFLNDAGDITYSVMPRPARVVSFPGNILHCARGVSRSCPTARITLIFKTKANQ
jgi:hypothetical protein